MGEGVEHRGGKILGLARLLTGEHGTAIEYDLLDHGWHPRQVGPVLSWTEFEVFMQHLPATPESAYFRVRHPTDYWYGITEQFSAAILHAIQSGNWQRGGGKGTRPQIYEPPRPKAVRRKASTGFTTDTIGDELAARRARAIQRKEAN